MLMAGPSRLVMARLWQEILSPGLLPVFIKFYWHTAMPICLCIVYAAFILEWQS